MGRADGAATRPGCAMRLAIERSPDRAGALTVYLERTGKGAERARCRQTFFGIIRRFMLYFSRCGLDFFPQNTVRLSPRCAVFLPKSGRVAQLAEHSALNRQVVGSIPTASTNYINQLGRFSSVIFPDIGENTKNPASILPPPGTGAILGLLRNQLRNSVPVPQPQDWFLDEVVGKNCTTKGHRYIEWETL